MSPRQMPPAWTAAITLFRAAQHERGLGAAANDYTSRVRRLARDVAPLGPWELDAEDVRRWLDGLDGTLVTRRTYASAVRRFYEWAVADGRTDHNPAPGRAPRPGPARASVPPHWAAWLDAWRTALRAAGYPETTVGLRIAHLTWMCRQLRSSDPATVTGAQLIEWFATNGAAPETRRSYRATVRLFYRWAIADGRTESDPARNLPPMRGSTPNPHPASGRAYASAMEAADPREALMLRLAGELGLRRGEVSRVHTRDLLEDDDGWSLLVHGKGNRDRIMPLPDGLAAALRAVPAGWAFPSPCGGHLTADYIGKRVAQLLPNGVTMHALRHRFATRAYDLEHDVFTVQQLLGHASPNTTRRYVKVTRSTLRRTVVEMAS